MAMEISWEKGHLKESKLVLVIKSRLLHQLIYNSYCNLLMLSVPSLSAAWFSDIVIPAVIVSIVVVVSLFAIVVLLLLRRHMAFEGHENGLVEMLMLEN